MFTITLLATEYRESHITTLFDEDSLEILFIDAVREYQAWASLNQENQRLKCDGGILSILSEAIMVKGDTKITTAEWGVIKPLAYLYVERQEAMIQEASKNHMHEQFGRTSSEVEQDITAYRNDQMRRLAFRMPIVTI